MRFRRINGHSMIRVALAAIMLVAPGAALAAEAPPGAASCSGCHPVGRSVDTSVSRLNGRDAAEITAAMAEFRAGQRPTTVMDRIAKGFTDGEINAIAAWYAAQKD
jgi:cytochrome subunit of sulfide dehydrogenase